MTVAPPSPPFIAARHHGGSQTPRAVVMHATVSPDNPGTARDIANWWAGPSSPVTSAHYVVDPRETIQCVGDHTVAYHCGYNTGSIAVEMCDEQTGPASRWADADSRAIVDRSAELVARLCLAYGIEMRRPSIAELKAKGPHGIYGHDDSRRAFGHTTHTDPRDFDWPGFIARVRAAAAAITGGPHAITEEDDMASPEDIAHAVWAYQIGAAAEPAELVLRRARDRAVQAATKDIGAAVHRAVAGLNLDVDEGRLAAEIIKQLDTKEDS
ncbi:MAG TPA: peptidoglycan recognition family protein [Nocardioidaceae bacterium]|nr:peptidoglycan recognition family protein [Nocardioidaceae bacterium]